MSNTLILASRFALRKCRGHRFSSSDASGELQRRAPHVPISTDFGGIQIQPSPRTRRAQSSNDIVVDISRIQQRRTGDYNVPISTDFGDIQIQPSQRTRRVQSSNDKRRMGDYSTEVEPSASYQEGNQSQFRKQPHARMNRGALPENDVKQERPDMERRSRPDGQRRAWRREQMDKRQAMPDEDLMQTRRHFRPGSGSRRQRRMGYQQQEYSNEDHDVEEWGENDESITTLQSGTEDVTLPHRPPSLLTPLTNLGIRVTDMPLTEARERVGGDYMRHFASGELERVRAQSSLSLGVLDRARLALSLNRTIGLEEKKVGVDLVRKTMGKTAAAR